MGGQKSSLDFSDHQLSKRNQRCTYQFPYDLGVCAKSFVHRQDPQNPDVEESNVQSVHNPGCFERGGVESQNDPNDKPDNGDDIPEIPVKTGKDPELDLQGARYQ